MKTINVTFTDGEHEKLMEVKKKLSWHDFIMKLLKENQKHRGNVK